MNALKIANTNSDLNCVEIAKCGLAISQAETQMDQFLSDYASQLKKDWIFYS